MSTKIKTIFPGLYFSDFHWGVRVSTSYDWPSDYSGHGGCQIGKRRIVVHKYKYWFSKKMELGGGLLGVRVDPQEVLQNFLGINYLLRGRGSNPLNTALYISLRNAVASLRLVSPGNLMMSSSSER